LNVAANNIANAETVGFKQSRAQFAELFAVSSQGVSRTQTGNGVKVATIAQQFSQGNVKATDSSLDLAISGQGFFTLRDNGAAAYTRSGSFTTDKDGFVVNTEGQRLQVYQPTALGTFNTTTPADLQLVASDSAPQATATSTIVYNLPANASVPATAVFDPAVPGSFNHSTSLTMYDSLGAAHTGSVYFVKSGAANSWSARLYIDGTAVGPAQAMVYSNTGQLTTPASGILSFPAYTPTTGAAAMTLAFDLGQSTQYGSNFSVTSVQQDGFTTGRLIGINVDPTGVVQARFTNGRSLPLGQIAVANFANAQGLQPLGNTNWAETFASGQPLNGQAGNSGFGLIQSGSLEQSNVDITAQLVNMITAQRNFQANAQMISTENQISQTLINIR
jgi:flagellar hook protein FlgE